MGLTVVELMPRARLEALEAHNTVPRGGLHLESLSHLLKTSYLLYFGKAMLRCVCVFLGVNTHTVAREGQLSRCIYLQCDCKVSKTGGSYERKSIMRSEVKESLLKFEVCHV